MAEPPALEASEDGLLGGRVRLRQPATGHRAGTDAVLLAAFAPARPGDRVLDLGSATGAVGLMVAARVRPARLTLVDLDPELIRLARANLFENGLAGNGEGVVADALADRAAWSAAGGPVDAVDLLVTNPPFHPTSGRPSPDPARRAAHVLDDAGLHEWIGTAARALKARGRLAMIHRADRIAACLAALEPAFGSLEIRFVHPRTEQPATRVLIRAVKGGRAPTSVLPPLVLHGPDGHFTPEAESIHAGTTA